MKTEIDALGDRCKAAEDAETMRKALPSEIIMVRLDGHGFSKFTKGLARPYDERMSALMIDAVGYVVTETGAVLGYTQSDEITLVFVVNNTDTVSEKHYFAGRFQKIATTCASSVTAFFNKHLAARLPEKAHCYPAFDGRAWAVPTIKEAYENLLWRERDAIKNSITMAATEMFSHTLLHGVRSAEKKQMMLEKGINWTTDYPAFFTRGTFVKRVSMLRELSATQLACIPAERRPTGPVMRSTVMALNMPNVSALADYAMVLFQKEIGSTVVLRDGSTHNIAEV